MMGDSKKISEPLHKEIAQDLGTAVSYNVGSSVIVGLYSDGFISSSKDIAAFKIVNIGSAYWKNSEANEQLVRLYCLAFSTQKEMDAYLKQREEAELRSHIKLGKELGLFVSSELVGPGLPLLAPWAPARTCPARNSACPA